MAWERWLGGVEGVIVGQDAGGRTDEVQKVRGALQVGLDEGWGFPATPTTRTSLLSSPPAAVPILHGIVEQFHALIQSVSADAELSSQWGVLNHDLTLP